MLDAETKARIDSARDILVGKVPDPKSQVEQITIALIYKFMDDMDRWDERYDVIMANPPFMSPKGGIRPHNRFSIKARRSEVLFVDYSRAPAGQRPRRCDRAGRDHLPGPEGLQGAAQAAAGELPVVRRQPAARRLQRDTTL